MEALNTAQGARDFIYSLHSSERSCLLKELHRFESIAIAQEKLEAQPPTPGQLRYVFIHNAIPFIGFGFLDNAIMIVAGTHIELSIGIILGISTMAAAALGNLVSDLAGLGLAGYVEALASRLGLSIPDLSPKQVDMWQTRVSSHLGKAVGVTIGCILGMFPLIFFGGDTDRLLHDLPLTPSSTLSHAALPLTLDASATLAFFLCGSVDICTDEAEASWVKLLALWCKSRKLSESRLASARWQSLRSEPPGPPDISVSTFASSAEMDLPGPRDGQFQDDLVTERADCGWSCSGRNQET
ncbi:hypothetical protein CapIbe_012358 [Capra ibex]